MKIEPVIVDLEVRAGFSITFRHEDNERTYEVGSK